MESSVQFESVMRLPHRRHAFGVNAPALFRHIGFRIEKPDDNPLTAIEPGASVFRRDKLIGAVNGALTNMQKGVRPDDIYSFCMSKETANKRRLLISETLLIDLKGTAAELTEWRSRLRLEMYDEYYFVTLILDQTGHQAHPVAIGKIEHQLSSNEKQHIDSEKFLQTYYHGIWDTVDRFIGDGLNKFPGRRFTEFRGIVLRELTNPFRQDSTAADAHKITKLNPAVSSQSRNLLRSWIARNGDFVSEVLQLKQWAGTTDQDANCVLSELLDGGAIYFSSVRQAHISSTSTDPPPLRYFILYNGLSKYQLGRLIRRTHVLGELRCAAVLDMELLDDASAGLRSLGNQIDDLLVNKSASLSDKQLRSVQEELNRLASSKIPGGLLYRVNRSRYYANTFRERIQEMRVQPLEGWQSYSEFFRRNLYPHFDHIDQIGKRYEALAERVNRLTNARNAEKLNEFETNSLKLVRKMNQFNGTMLRIQEIGEWIGVTAFTYYGGHIIANLFREGPKLLKMCSVVPEDMAEFCSKLGDKPPEHFLFVGIVMAFVAAILLRMWWHRKARETTDANDSDPLLQGHLRASTQPGDA
jgi:hypothetical protein